MLDELDSLLPPLDPEDDREAMRKEIARLRKQLQRMEAHTPSSADLPAPPKPSVVAHEARRDPRYPVRWRVAILGEMNGHRETYYGVINDLSVSGASIHCDHHHLFGDDLTLLISVPPLHQGAKQTVTQVRARVVYNVLCSTNGQFRIGFQFLGFDHGETQLHERLAHAKMIRDV